MKILESILDSCSFVAINSLLKNANVVGGYGTIDNRLVYIYEQEGVITASHAKKISNIYESALKVGAPVIGIFDSKGMALDDGVACFDAYAEIMQKLSFAKGKVPLISIVVGDCIGTMALLASMSDFVIKSKNAKFYLQIVNASNSADLNTNTDAHIICENDSECIKKAQTLLSLLPSNCLDMYTTPLQDDLNRTIPATDNVQDLISAIADKGVFVELQSGYTDIVTSIVSCGGHPTGILAAQGKMGASAFEKATAFIEKCSSLHIPLITFTNTCAYENSKYESEKLITNAARWVNAITSSQIPKINIIQNAAGGPYLLMNSKSLGADIAYAWPDARIGIVDSEASQKILKQDTSISSQEAGEQGLIDDVIEPSETRKRIIAALEMLYSKRGR